MLFFEEASIQNILENLEIIYSSYISNALLSYSQIFIFFNEFEANLGLANAT